jgi:hypothetical protein
MLAEVNVVATPVLVIVSLVVLSIAGQDGNTLIMVEKFRVPTPPTAIVVDAVAPGTAVEPFISSTVTSPAVVPSITPSKVTK